MEISEELAVLYMHHKLSHLHANFSWFLIHFQLVTLPSPDRHFQPLYVASYNQTALNFNQSNYFHKLHFLFEVAREHS